MILKVVSKILLAVVTSSVFLGKAEVTFMLYEKYNGAEWNEIDSSEIDYWVKLKWNQKRRDEMATNVAAK